ncbi:MAG: ATP-binding protein [Natronincolaceae bacterium]|jgi:archaellum biogenesis ATPase FlaH|nr:ATP-binding protein [Bacillota bacterium]NLK90160.1 ATP-binding protein [Clostridiales bacterium]
MIRLIVGAAGTGKTKMLTQLANEDIKKTKGHLVYIDYEDGRMLQIDHRIRYISIDEYQVSGEQGLYGFICGIIASNYDIETIYIDGLYKIINVKSDNSEEFFKKLNNIGHKHNVNFVLTMSCDKEELPGHLETWNRA